MKSLTIIFVFITLFVQASCKKDDPVVVNKQPQPENPWNYKSILNVKWYKYFYSDTSGAYFQNPYFFDNYVVFCSDMIAYGNGKLGIGVFDKLTGAKHPMWNNEPGGIVGSTGSISNWVIGGNSNKYAIFCSTYKIYCYDLETGSLHWNISVTDLEPRICSFGNYIFYIKGDMHSYSTLLLTNIESGQSKNVLTLYKTNGYEANIEPPVVWFNPSGDTILVFQNRQWNFPASDGKIDIYAYNLSKDTIIWKLEDLTNDGNSSVRKPIINEDKFYFQGMKSVHCINLLNGQLIWEHEYTDEGFAQVENLFADGKLFVHSGSDAIMAFNGNSGNLLWKTNKDYGIQTGGSMGYYKGKLYFTSIDMTNSNIPTYLFCLNASDGSLVWKDSGVVKSGMKDGIIIDQNTGYLYADDSYRIMCIDLNNTPKPK